MQGRAPAPSPLPQLPALGGAALRLQREVVSPELLQLRFISQNLAPAALGRVEPLAQRVQVRGELPDLVRLARRHAGRQVARRRRCRRRDLLLRCP